MGSDIVSALCGACKVPLVAVPDHDPKDWFACPRCGEGDTRENMLRVVGEHAQELSARFLQEEARKTAGRVKFIQFKGKPIPKRSYRFISDLKL
jgi:hypothetical protein